jgi:hypothetical protein
MRARLFGFDRLPAPWGGLTIRSYQPGDEHEILATFNRVFARIDVTFRPRTLGFWRWRFLENPSGSSILLAVTEDGKVAGQLASINQRMRMDGASTYFSQGVDQMTAPEVNQGLRRGNLVGVFNNTFQRLHAGERPDQHSLGWGTPVPTAWRSGKSFARYQIVRTQLKLRAAPGEIAVGPAGGVALEEVRAFPEDVVELFERCTALHAAIAVRDKAQLDWRWVAHPEKRARIVLARRGGELLGYAVLVRGDFDGERDLALVADHLVAPREPAATAALLGWLADCARDEGLAQVTTILPDSAPEWLDFQSARFRVAPTRYFFIGKQYRRAYDVRWMNRHWYYTLGDTDLV